MNRCNVPDLDLPAGDMAAVRRRMYHRRLFRFSVRA